MPQSPRELHPTPLDFVLLLTARFFPLDVLLVAMYTALMLCATAVAFRTRCGQIGCGAAPRQGYSVHVAAAVAAHLHSARALSLPNPTLTPHCRLGRIVPAQTLRPRGSVASSLLALTSGVLLAGFTLTAQLVTAAPEYAAYGLQSRPHLTDAEPRCAASCGVPAAIALPRRLNSTLASSGGASYAEMMGGHGTHHDAGHVCGVANGALLVLTLEREVRARFMI